MYCKKCGANNVSGAKVCANCGEALPLNKKKNYLNSIPFTFPFLNKIKAENIYLLALVSYVLMFIRTFSGFAAAKANSYNANPVYTFSSLLKSGGSVAFVVISVIFIILSVFSYVFLIIKNGAFKTVVLAVPFISFLLSFIGFFVGCGAISRLKAVEGAECMPYRISFGAIVYLFVCIVTLALTLASFFKNPRSDRKIKK